jgi:pilus assembly protein FimV
VSEAKRYPYKKRAAAIAVASCLSLAPWFAEAASLGKLTVYSALGQPLRAELEVGASREELAGMTAKLAPRDVFSQSGLDFAPVLGDLRFAVEKRSNGQAVVKVTTAKPINEPFLDFLVELNWPAGRLVREYTFLLDPPEMVTRSAGGQVSVAEAKVIEMTPGGRNVANAKPASASVAPKVSADEAKRADEPKRLEDIKKEEAPPSRVDAKPERGIGHVVKAGETLRKIAADNKYDGVSLEQMLVALYRNNQEAFMGRNLNRLKSGAILGLPDKATVEAISEKEAKKVYAAQASDWNAYRQKLGAAAANAPAREESAVQSASGKVAAKVEEKVPAAEQAKDQVKVSKTELAAKGGTSKAAEADLIARERALSEAQERVALLERNVADLQKLLEMKNQKLADLQQSAVKKPEAPAEPVKAPEVQKPVEVAKPVEPPKVEESKPEAVKPAEELKPAEENKPVEPVKPVEPTKAPEAKPVQPLKPAVVEPPEEEEVSLLDTLAQDPAVVAGGGGILALLLGLFLVKRRRGVPVAPETTAAPVTAASAPNSVFRSAGGQSVDTANTSPHTSDFSQTGPGTIDTDEVDPVAEADVYMAYGRDLQAEEILLEALQKDPQRAAIHVKLLEIYAARQSLKQFETLASELYALTSGVGPEWAKAVALGVALDPTNPLYRSANKASAAPVAQAASYDADATLVVSHEDLGKLAAVVPEPVPEVVQPVMEATFEPAPEPVAEVVDTSTMAFELPAQEALTADEPVGLDFDLGESQPAPVVADVEPAPVEELSALDFDLPKSPEVAVEAPAPAVPEMSLPSFDIDLDLKSGAPESMEPLSMPMVDEQALKVEEAPAADAAMDFDFDLDMPQPSAGEQAAEADLAAALADAALSLPEPVLDVPVSEPAAQSGVDFDVKLTDSVFLGEPAQSDFDMASINLDLAAGDASAAAPDASSSAQWEEVNTKLDLAKAYEEMGDLEGARELLKEVAAEGTPDLVEQARSILARING